jgi:Kef-type K+ transport system membrane component KefB
VTALSVTAFLALLLVAARLGGALFARLRQPRVVGEIAAGALVSGVVSALGLTTGALAGGEAAGPARAVVCDLLSTTGFALLMFVSGAGMRRLLPAEDRKVVAWLATSGTALPFAAAVALASWVPLDVLLGPARSHAALILVLGFAAAVTSIPVISRIFHDLKVLDSRFARLVLGVAVVEDVVLWAVLPVATALARAGDLPGRRIAGHVALSLLFVVMCLALGPRLVRTLRSAAAPLVRRVPGLWLALLLVAFLLAGKACDVPTFLAAFFAGLALVPGAAAAADSGVETAEAAEARALQRLEGLAYATIVPLAFAVVGVKLELGAGFSPLLVLALIAVACAVKLASVALGAWRAGFRGLDVVNLAVATNARGGPGIVLAAVAYEERIVNGAGYTALVLLAVVTSQLAGAWLEWLLRRGRPLLAGDVAAPVTPVADVAPAGGG